MMRTTTHSCPTIRRAAFTLVEVMVAAALSVVIMTIIATAFQVGLDTTSQLKSIGGLADQLRTAHGIIRSDLRADHLWDGSESAGSLQAVSELTTTWNGDPNHKGFFKVVAPSPTIEGTPDGYGLGSARATDQWLHFTVRLGSTSPEDVFSAKAPTQVWKSGGNLAGLAAPNEFASNWAEVMYSLHSQGTTTISDPPGSELPLHTLRRRQRVIAQNDLGLTLTTADLANYPELSIGGTAVNTPITIQTDGNRSASGTTRPTGLPTDNSISSVYDYRGSDIVLANVISMRIQVLKDNDVEYSDLNGTWDSATTPTSRLRAVRIQLRVYDPKNRLTRQITIDQAL